MKHAPCCCDCLDPRWTHIVIKARVSAVSAVSAVLHPTLRIKPFVLLLFRCLLGTVLLMSLHVAATPRENDGSRRLRRVIKLVECELLVFFFLQNCGERAEGLPGKIGEERVDGLPQKTVGNFDAGK